MGRGTVVSGLAAVVLSMLACNALTGIADLSVDTSTDGGRLDASNDAGRSDAALPSQLACPGAGVACVPAPPAGWQGPFLAYEGDRAAAPNCPPNMPVADDENIGEPVGTITCGACQCGPVMNMTCGAATVHEFTDGTCTLPDLVDVDPATCQHAANGVAVGISVTVATNGGSCTSSATPPTKSAITWPKVLRLCGQALGSTTSGCSPDQRCTGQGVAPGPTEVCIVNALGPDQCPAPYTQRIHTFPNVADDRNCDPTSCSCDPPTGAVCSGTLRLYTNTSCSGGGNAFTNHPIPTTACLDLPATGSVRTAGGFNLSPGSCSPSGKPTPTGSVTADSTSQKTVCCIPAAPDAGPPDAGAPDAEPLDAEPPADAEPPDASPASPPPEAGP